MFPCLCCSCSFVIYFLHICLFLSPSSSSSIKEKSNQGPAASESEEKQKFYAALIVCSLIKFIIQTFESHHDSLGQLEQSMLVLSGRRRRRRCGPGSVSLAGSPLGQQGSRRAARAPIIQ